ncbi:MAG: hypothetical protein WC553_01560 [Patescibacteria group bacterium]
MSVLKTLGLGMYYRVRRISKAFKNWKRFGVVIFGSLFIASSLLPSLVSATGSLTMAIYPTNSTVTLGSDKVYTAQVFNGITNITANAQVTWFASLNNQTVTTGSGASWVFRPNTAGTYTINANANVGGDVVWADARATLIVNSTEDNREYGVSISALTSGNTINVGESKTYSVNATYGGQPVTGQSTFGWVVTKNSQTVASNGTGTTYTFTPTTSGTYVVRTRGIYTINGITKTAWSNEQTLIVDPVTPPQPSVHLTVSLYPTASNPIYVGNYKTYTAQAFNGTTEVTTSSLTSFAWEAWRNNQKVGQSAGITWKFYPDTAGTYTIKVKGTYNGVQAWQDASATLTVLDNPQTEFCSAINIDQSSLNLYRNDSREITYTTLTNLDNPISTSNLVWSWDGGSFNLTTHRYYATQTGDFTLSLRCGSNSAVRDSVSIHVSDFQIQEDYLADVDINSDRNPLCSTDVANLSAQARNNHGAEIDGASYYWEWVSGVGNLTGNRYSQYGARLAANGAVGTARVRVTATWDNRSVSNEMTISLRDCSVVTNYYIDGYITATTENGLPVCDDSIVVYTVRLTNRYATSHNVSLSMPLPNNVSFMSATSAVDDPQITGRTIIWNPGTMAEGQTVTMVVKVQVDEGIRRGTDLKVSALVRSTEKPNGFYVYSNSLKVVCGTTPITPTEPLPPTGMEVVWLSILAVISLGLSTLTYRWIARRGMNYSV